MQVDEMQAHCSILPKDKVSLLEFFPLEPRGKKLGKVPLRVISLSKSDREKRHAEVEESTSCISYEDHLGELSLHVSNLTYLFQTKLEEQTVMFFPEMEKTFTASRRKMQLRQERDKLARAEVERQQQETLQKASEVAQEELQTILQQNTATVESREVSSQLPPFYPSAMGEPVLSAQTEETEGEKEKDEEAEVKSAATIAAQEAASEKIRAHYQHMKAVRESETKRTNLEKKGSKKIIPRHQRSVNAQNEGNTETSASLEVKDGLVPSAGQASQSQLPIGDRSSTVSSALVEKRVNSSNASSLELLGGRYPAFHPQEGKESMAESNALHPEGRTVLPLSSEMTAEEDYANRLENKKRVLRVKLETLQEEFGQDLNAVKANLHSMNSKVKALQSTIGDTFLQRQVEEKRSTLQEIQEEQKKLQQLYDESQARAQLIRGTIELRAQQKTGRGGTEIAQEQIQEGQVRQQLAKIESTMSRYEKMTTVGLMSTRHEADQKKSLTKIEKNEEDDEFLMHGFLLDDGEGSKRGSNVATDEQEDVELSSSSSDEDDVDKKRDSLVDEEVEGPWAGEYAVVRGEGKTTPVDGDEEAFNMAIEIQAPSGVQAPEVNEAEGEHSITERIHQIPAEARKGDEGQESTSVKSSAIPGRGRRRKKGGKKQQVEEEEKPIASTAQVEITDYKVQFQYEKKASLLTDGTLPEKITEAPQHVPIAESSQSRSASLSSQRRHSNAPEHKEKTATSRHESQTASEKRRESVGGREVKPPSTSQSSKSQNRRFSVRSDTKSSATTSPVVTPVQHNIALPPRHLPSEGALEEIIEAAVNKVDAVKLKNTNADERLQERGKQILQVEKQTGVAEEVQEADIPDETVEQKEVRKALAEETEGELKDEIQLRERMRKELEGVEKEHDAIRQDIRSLTCGTDKEKEAIAHQLVYLVPRKEGKEEVPETAAMQRQRSISLISSPMKIDGLDLESIQPDKETRSIGIQTVYFHGHSTSGSSSHSIESTFKHEELFFICFKNLLAAVANIYVFHRNLEVELTCKYCWCVMKNPKTLWPCGHSFCSSCLQYMYKSSELIECVECGRLSHQGYTPNVALEAVMACWTEGGGGQATLQSTLRSLNQDVMAVKEDISTVLVEDMQVRDGETIADFIVMAKALAES